MRPRVPALLAVSAAILSVLVAITVEPGRAAAAATPLLEKKVIGFSVRHRPIVAYHLGDPRKRPVLIIGQMHGDERAGVSVVNSIVHGRSSIEGINLWVVPSLNPDGYAAHRRQNAHGVDLNRNWPHRWARLTGAYYSGGGPLSEPETRAMYRFLRTLRPRYVVAIHQPLYGVDTTDGGAVDPAFRNRLARGLGLPRKAFRCWSTCHGSMTGWYTARHYGVAITVEFGAHPSQAYLTGKARRAIVAALGGRFGSIAAHDPRSSLTGSASADGAVRLRGWAFDVDARGTSLRFALTRDGTVIRRATADGPSAALNAHYGLTGAHGLAVDLTAPPGPHRFCATFTNVGAGTGNPQRCVTVTVPQPPSRTPAPPPSSPTPPA